MTRFISAAAVLLALACGLLVAYAYRPLRLAAAALAGRANGCTVARAWNVEAQDALQTRVKDKILAGSKLLRTENGLELYQTPYGPFWAPAGSQYILPLNLAEEEIHIYGTGDRFVRKGDIVLDCGANVGAFSRFALDAGAAQVIAIEPAPDNLECLRRNFPKEISEGRLVVYPKGVWDRDDMLELLIDPTNQAADSFVIHRDSAKSSVRVPLTTIDRLASELKLERVDYIKMDIEGAEVRALLGAHQTIRRFHPRMSLCVYHQKDHPVEVPRAARAAWPSYRTECGPCYLSKEGEVRPEVLYFF